MEHHANSGVFAMLQPGSTISHYEIVAPLGEGGNGVVFKAFDNRLKRPVALKFLIQEPEGEESKQRLLSEAQATAALDHPNICSIYEVEEAEGYTFISMACVSGVDLRKRKAAGPMPLEEVLDIAAQVAEGLHVAHDAGLVHRDIKPGNILIADDGTVKIVDFGLAQRVDATTSTEGGLAGTYNYMSPEQVAGRDLDRRTDLWSWGVVLYEMLAGVRPFRRDTAPALFAAISREAAAPIRALRPGLPDVLERVLDRALQKNPQQRYQSAAEILADLEELLSAPGMRSRRRVPAPTRVPSPAADGKISIAVLPFVNTSADPDNEFFSDGLTDELINVLANCRGLRVVSRTSAFAFKGKAENIRDIGEKLRVQAVLEGSVRRAGNRLRVTAQLIDVRDGYHLWSGKYDRKLQDIFAIQDEIAQTAASALALSLQTSSPDATAKPEINLQAYHHYLRGRYYWNQMTGEGFQKALSHFQEALQLDPLYGAAYAGIADYFTTLGIWSLAAPSAVWPQAKAAALKAVELDGSLPEAHIALGYMHIFYEWDRRQAGKDFAHALELNPGLSIAHYSYAIYLVQVGRLEEAINSMVHAKDLDPLSLLVCSGVGFTFFYARQYDRAIAEHRKVLEFDPHYVYSLFGLGLVYQALGSYEKAIEYLEQAGTHSGGSSLILGFLGECYGLAGRREKALETLQQLDQQAGAGYVSPVSQALVYIGLGEKSVALDWLEKSAETRAVLLAYLSVMPAFDPLRSEPRLIAIERRMAMPLWDGATQ
jgi:eukaryotic-like serine/threonine-protein kinase